MNCSQMTLQRPKLWENHLDSLSRLYQRLPLMLTKRKLSQLVVGGQTIKLPISSQNASIWTRRCLKITRLGVIVTISDVPRWIARISIMMAWRLPESQSHLSSSTQTSYIARESIRLTSALTELRLSSCIGMRSLCQSTCTCKRVEIGPAAW